MSKRLPLSLQDFRTIIEGGYKYVDKTAYIQQIAKDQGAYFLSRPRRFGKSITIASFYELFKGKHDVFKGLAIEQRWDWNQSYPVLRISFTDLDYLTLGLERALAERMEDLARLHNIELRKSTAKDRFLELLQNLSTQAKVVVLVDEYDAPILDYLGTQPKKAFENREILRNFYKVIKDVDHLLRFVFITGVSKFSKVGVFSGLNNLIDLSFEPEFATILGYTQSELETSFAEELALAGEHLNLDQPSLLAQIKTWYNGYRFAPHAETVYNPVSVNYFLQKKRFENYWFATGTPTFLMQLLKKEGLYDLQFPHTNLNGFNSFELENLKVIAVLYQAGYLTIAEEDEDGLYRLDYPNKEVNDSMLENLLETFAGVNAESSSALVIKLRKAFEDHDLEQVIRILKSVFKDIPYFLHEHYPEKFFHAAIHLLFNYLGVRTQSEVASSNGRLDAVVQTPTQIFILEFKLDQSAEKALAQIKRKEYHQVYWNSQKPIIGIGINFSSEIKNIQDWKTEQLS